jgi:hypothetical protein
MRARRVRLALTALAVACPAGVCSAEESEADEDTAALAARRGCFYTREAQDFQVLDRSTLIVYAPTRRSPYLVRISPPASALRVSDALLFDSRSNRICGRAGDSLTLASDSRRRYSIVDVRRLEPGQLDRIVGGAAPAGAGGTLEPSPDTAADIEALDETAD